MATPHIEQESDDVSEIPLYINSLPCGIPGEMANTSSQDIHQNVNTYTDACSGDDSEKTTALLDDGTDDDILKLLTCSTCHNQYKDPKLLVCLHSCCADCIKTYMDGDKTKIICNYCRNSQILPEGGPATLSPSYTLVDIISAFNGSGQVKDVCEVCEQQKCPEFACPTCKVVMCDSCRTAHGNLKITKNHEILPAKSVKISPLAMVSGKREKICEKHGDTISHRCKTCGVFVCYKDITMEHKGHKLNTLKEIRDIEKKSINELERKAKQTIIFSKSLLSSVKSHESVISERLKAVELKVDQTTEDIVKMLNEQASSLKDKIKSRKDQETKNMGVILQEALQIERASTSVRNIMQKISSNSSDLDALTLYSCCEQIFTEAGAENVGITYGNELFFRPSEFLLQLQTSKECGTICEIGSYPDFLHTNEIRTTNSVSDISGMARSKYGEVVLTSFWNNKCVLLGPEGAIIRDISNHVTRPWDVAFTNDNAIVVSEGGDTVGQGKLKLFSPGGSFIRTIIGGSKSPGGITVDRKGRLLVCDDHEACVKVFSIDGNLVDQIKGQDSEYQFQGPLYVATNINDDVIVCDDHRSIKIFNCTGQAKNIYKVNDKHHLQGICTDSYGQILVVDSLQKGVHVLTANGILRRFVTLEALNTHEEIQSICSRSLTSVLIAGKSSKVLEVELFQQPDLSKRVG